MRICSFTMQSVKEKGWHMAIGSFRELKERAKNVGRKCVAVAAANDAHTLEAVFRACDEGLMDYILVGDGQRIEEAAGALGHALRRDGVFEEKDEALAVKKALAFIHTGEADFLQKGLLPSAMLLRGVLNKEYGIGTGRLISHVSLLEAEGYPKLLGVTDGGIVLYPDLEQKRGIIRNAAALFHRLGNPKPKVAALCAIEEINPRMPETVDAAALKADAQAGALGSCILEGPISMDLAVSRESGRIKGFDSPVCGDADILLVPDIVSGNLTMKALQAFSKAKMAGCVVGASCPIALTSRSASFEEKYDSLLVCALLAD